MSGDDEDRLARFLERRDEEAFRHLYRAHSPFLYRFLFRWTGGNEALAEEGVQETWVRAVRALPGFERRSSLRTWLAGIAIRWYREESRRAVRGEPLPAGESAAGVTPIRLENERVDLERAIAALPEGYREALILHDLEGYTHAESARLLGVDPGTSKSQLSRARQALRGLLAGGAHGRTGRSDG